MAIQMRRGLRQDFDPTQMVAGEWAVSVDSSTSNQIVWMCFGAGVVKRMGTYEDFQTMIGEITDDIRDDMLAIEAEVQALADAVGDDKDAVALMKTTIEQTDLPAIQDYVTTCQTSAQNASLSASNASGSATQASTKATEAQSWAIGGTGTRQGEDTNNAKYWSERAQSTSLAQSDWTENDDTDPSYIAHKPFKTIGTGLSVDNNGALNANGVSSYNDLSNKPQINGNTLTGNKSNADLGIPTKTSDLQNDSGFITDIPVATANTAGKVKPDGTTITIDQNGTLSATGGSGGMDWESVGILGAVNMLPSTAKSKLLNGVTFTVADDGTITANGTATADIWYCIYTATATEAFVGKTVKMRGCPSGGGNNTYSLYAFRAETTGGTGGDKRDTGEGVEVNWINDGSGNKAQVYINVSNGQTLDNLKFEPMIVVPSYDGDYVPYAKTNYELTTVGDKALYDYINEAGAKNFVKITAQTRTQDGVTFTINADGTITINGTATATTQVNIANNLGLDSNKTYILSGCPARSDGVMNYALMYFGDGGSTSDVGDGEVTITPFPNDHLNVWIKEGYTADNLVIKPMIRIASIADDTYVPYAMTNTNFTQSLETLSNNVLNLADMEEVSISRSLGGNTWTEIFKYTATANESLIFLGVFASWGNPNAIAQLSLAKNGTGVTTFSIFASGSDVFTQGVPWVIHLTAGDIFTISALKNTGGNISLNGTCNKPNQHV